MNKHDHKHSDSHAHDHKHAHNKSVWKPHRDWRVWVVALMLFAMVMYVLSLDESIQPRGIGPAVPAAPAGAP